MPTQRSRFEIDLPRDVFRRARRSEFGMGFAVGPVTDQVDYDVFIEAVYVDEEPEEAP